MVDFPDLNLVSSVDGKEDLSCHSHSEENN